MQFKHKRLRYTFLNFENCQISEPVSAYLEAPHKKTDGILAKALDLNFSLPEGKGAATNRLDARAPNVMVNKTANLA